ncbi:hypothetical protein [Solirubrobacter soli]|uniref:hypothetical protein n=1 Tax=Solirubrobacter soli TaxID=363832 RepID=UPI0003FDFD5E|nr:hypothetical protein [Solirubrobacter soli]
MSVRLVLIAAIAFGVWAGRADAQVVAGGLPGLTLDVADTTNEDGEPQLKVTLTSPDVDEDGGRLVEPDSGDAPVWPDQAIVASGSVERPDGSMQVYAGGAVSADAATVELTYAGGKVLRLPTVAGEAYTGRDAGRVRFFLGELTLGEDADDDPDSVRVLDASGTVIGVPVSDSVLRKARVLRRRAGGALVRAWVQLFSEVQALPNAPEHRDEGLCLQVGVNGSGGDEHDVACQQPDVPLILGGRRGCGRVPTTLTGFVPAGTDHLTVTLGSGRTVTTGTRALPFGHAGQMVLTLLPRGEAIRSAVALDANGRTLAGGQVLVAPPDRRCRTDYPYEDWRFYGELDERPGIPPGTETAASLGDAGPRLLVRDDGERLCAGIDTLDLNGLDCYDPPAGGYEPDSVFSDFRRGFVAGIFPARVAAIDIEFLDGSKLRAPAVPGTGYTGQYHDFLHFVLVPAPVGKFVKGATLLDAAGRSLGRTFTSGTADDPALVGAPKTALRVGSERLRTGAFNTPIDPRDRVRCIALDDDDCLDGAVPTKANSINVRVRCDRRQTVIYGVARRGVRGVDVGLVGGRRVKARVAAFGDLKVYLAVLGPRVAVSDVHFAGGPANNGSHTFVLPGREPARQCGYESFGELF